MSQYPSPYSPPPPNPYGYYPQPYPPYPSASNPAARAGILILVLGSLFGFCGLCVGGGGAIVPWDQMPPETAEAMRQAEALYGMPVKRLAIWTGSVVGVIALLLLLAGAFVRKGSKGAIILALALCGILTLFFALQVIGAIIQPGRFAEACFALLLVAMFLLATFWLVQALRNPAPAMDPQAQYAQYQQQYYQYWQQQQQQQMYGQAPPPGPVSPPLGPPPRMPEPPPPPQEPPPH